MNRGKQLINRILELKYLKIFYMVVIVAFTSVLSYYRISLLPKWPNEIITLTLFIVICLLISLFVFNSLNKNNREWTAFFFVYLASFLLMLYTSYISINISEFEGPFFLIPMLFTLILGTQTSAILNVTFSSAFFILLDENVELYFYFILFGLIACFTASFFKSIKKTIIATCFLLVANIGINILFQSMVYDDIFISKIVMKFFMLIIDVLIAWIIAIFVNKLVADEYKKQSLIKKCQENFPPILELKNKHNDVYMHSLQVAELAVNAAKAIDADVLIVKAGSLYHDIGKFKSNNYIKSSLEIARKYNLPIKVQKTISEHNGNTKKPSNPESAIIMLADTVLSTIDRIEKSKGRIDLTEEKIINNVFNIRIESGALSESGLDLNKLYKIKKSFIEFFKWEE